MKTPDQKYTYDREFRTLVDYMIAAIANNKYTPSEMREAAVYACIRYERFVAHTSVMPIDEGVSNALHTIENWIDKENT